MSQAQQYVIATQHSTTGTFTYGFGVHFDLPARSTSYVLFNDLAGNGIYQSSPTDEAVPPSPYNITNGNTIVDLCATQTCGVTEQCYIAGQMVNRIDILYKRPNPDAYISINNQTCIQTNADGTFTKYQSNCMWEARIELQSPRNDHMWVVVQDAGQITIQ